MFLIVCRRRLSIHPNWGIFLGPQSFYLENAVFGKLFSSKISSPPGVCRNDSEKSFTASYLINSLCLSSEDALSLSEKVRIRSPENPDAVLELFRKYGFTNADIVRLVSKWPPALTANPEKTLLPKLKFFCSFGVPLPVLAETVSFNPAILHYSLKNFIIPWYNTLKGVVRSDERVVRVFLQATKSFRSIPSKIALLRGQGLPESSIASLLSRSPSLMVNSNEKIVACIHRAAEMGIDKNKIVFTHAIEVLAELSDSTLKHKIEVYRRCGWSDSDIDTAFSKFPICMKLSEKKIMANMNFLVHKMGLNPVVIAHCPLLLNYSLDKRMKPRFLIARILDTKGLKKMVRATTLLIQTEEVFVKSYIVPYQNDVPELVHLYRGKLSLDEMGFRQDELGKIVFNIKQDDADRS